MGFLGVVIRPEERKNGGEKDKDSIRLVNFLWN